MVTADGVPTAVMGFLEVRASYFPFACWITPWLIPPPGDRDNLANATVVSILATEPAVFPSGSATASR